MVRLALLYAFCLGVAVYAWKDWFKSLCGLILLAAVIQHPDVPKTMFGLQGLNPWNILLFIVVLSWARNRGVEELSWDLPRDITILLLLYLSVVVVGFYRMMTDQAFLLANPVAGLVSEYLINTVKWVVPGLLLFDGCRSRSRFTLAIFCVLAVYLLLGVQVIRWMPPSAALSGQELSTRSLKILVNEIGYHRVNLSMMLAGASWAMIAVFVLVEKNSTRILTIAAFLSLVYAQALTGGRMGYGTWALVGLVLALIRWKKVLLLVPITIIFVILLVPGVGERMSQGFSTNTRDSGPVVADFPGDDFEGPDLYTVTAGRNIAWHFVVNKIKEAPIFGYGRMAMQRTGLTGMLYDQYGEEFPHPHNAYLEMLLDNGLVGFLLVFPFYIVILHHGVSLFRDSRDPVFISIGGVSCALVLALLVGSMGSQTFYPREGSIGMWCTIGLMLRVYVERSRGFSWEKEETPGPDDGMFWTREPESR
jgi:O-antigen ligase